MFGHPLGYNFIVDSLHLLEKTKSKKKSSDSKTATRIRKKLKTKNRVTGLRTRISKSTQKRVLEN